MAGALLLNAGNPGAVVPVPADMVLPDLRVAANFERFDGLEIPDTNPAADKDPANGGSGLGANYGWTTGWNTPGVVPRPGQLDEPIGQVYTPGPLEGLVGVIGGQPLPVRDWKYQADGRDGYTGSRFPTIQFRQGQGQRGPSELGAAQTTFLGGITSNPPEPGDLSAIIAGVG